MIDFFQSQMDFILFFSGLSFFFFGFTFLLIYQIEKKETSWKYLVSFGILRGVYYWLLLFDFLFVHHALLRFFLITFDILSFAFLFEFGRRTFQKDSVHLGVWIYIPILFLFIFGVLFGGVHTWNTVLHLTLSFFGSILTGIYFWQHSSKKGMEQKYMRPIAVLFLLYGLFQLASNEVLFFQRMGFPSHLVCNFLAFLVFLFAWLQYLSFLKRDLFSHGMVLKKNKQWDQILSITLLVPVVYLVGFVLLNFLGGHAKTELRKESNAIISVTAESFQNTILLAKNMASMLSYFPEFADILVLDEQNTGPINLTLDRCNTVLGNSVCYVMNTEGTVIASSNRQASDSFLGKNYAFRPYFTQALSQEHGEYFALGVTSNVPGYYASHVIKNAQHTIVGVIVIKMNLNDMEKILHAYDQISLVSPEGIIFLSGDSSLDGGTLVSLSEAEKEWVQERQQFGLSELQPLFQEMPQKDTVVQWNNKVIYVNQKNVNDTGWSIVYFHPAQTIYYYRLFGIVLLLLFYIFAITTLVILQMIRRNAVFSYFASVIYATQDAVIGTKLNGEIETWNEGARRMYGYEGREMIGKMFHHLLPEQEQENNQNMLMQIRQGNVIENFEMQHRNKKGELFDVSISVSPIKDIEETNVGIAFVVRDISRAKQLEKMRTEFVSIASHQLRTPLTGIKWFSELLLNGRVGVLKKEQKEYLEQISESNQRMINLVNDLLEVSHIDAQGKFIMQKKDENFSLLIQEVLTQMHSSVTSKKIQIRSDEACTKKVLLSVDGTKIQQVLQNLLSNAIKFSHPGGVIRLQCKKEKDQLVFSIHDDGVGIPQHQQSRMFEKFFRADNAVDAGSGTGLGLYIAKTIVEAHGGSMWFESEEGKGTTFSFSLPRR